MSPILSVLVGVVIFNFLAISYLLYVNQEEERLLNPLRQKNAALEELVNVLRLKIDNRVPSGRYPTDRMINHYAKTHDLFIHIDCDMTPVIGRGHTCKTVMFHKSHTTEERQGMIDSLQEDCSAHLADIYGMPAVEFCNRDVWPGRK